jgi:hypothetical protein
MEDRLAELDIFLSERTPSKECGELLGKLDSLEGFSMEGFVNYIRKGVQVFDGTTSNRLAATTLVAGYSLMNLETISSLFNRNIGIIAATALDSANKLTIYVRPGAIDYGIKEVKGYNLSLIFHEALHGYGMFIGKSYGYTDSKIQDALKITIGSNTNNITTEMWNKCFEGPKI